jgi:hypothetical protein
MRRLRGFSEKFRLQGIKRAQKKVLDLGYSGVLEEPPKQVEAA